VIRVRYKNKLYFAINTGKHFWYDLYETNDNTIKPVFKNIYFTELIEI